MQGAYLLMDSQGFNLEAASSPNYMGLTVTAGNERALIVGWDGQKYTLETESGRRLKTADYIWNYDDMADPDVMEVNAKVAALRSEESPYKHVGGALQYNSLTGSWDAEVGDTSLAKVAFELDEDYYSDGEYEDDYTLEEEEDQAPQDCCGPEMTEDLKSALEEALSADPAEMDEIDRAFIDALPALLDAAADPEKDGAEDPAVQHFLDLYDAEGGEEEDADDEDGFFYSHTKTSFLPALAAGARMLLPAIGRGSMSGAASNLGGGGALSLLTGGDAGPAQPVNVQRGAEFGYNQNDNSILARSAMPDEHFMSVRQKVAGSEIIDIMREQVVNALSAASSSAKEIWGEHGDDLWYALMDSAASAKSVASLQSLLQTLPAEFHTAPGPQGAGEGQDAPTPEVMGIGGGADVGPAAASADSIPVSAEPGVPGGDAGPTGLGGGELVPGGGLGPGMAPGGGIPGGPGRRAGNVELNYRIREQLRNFGFNRLQEEFGRETWVLDDVVATFDPNLDSPSIVFNNKKTEVVAQNINDMFDVYQSIKLSSVKEANPLKKLYDKAFPVEKRYVVPSRKQDVLYFDFWDAMNGRIPVEKFIENMQKAGVDEEEMQTYLAKIEAEKPGLDVYKKNLRDNWTRPRTPNRQASEQEFFTALAASPAPPPLNQSGPDTATAQAEINAMVQQYIGQGVAPAQAYQQAAFDWQSKQQQQQTPAMTTLTPVRMPGQQQSVTPGMNYAASTLDANPVKQDGEDRANLKCPECDGQTVTYNGDDKFVCRTCGKEWNKEFRRSEARVKTAKGDSLCPNCDSNNWDYYNNDTARCRDCGYKWENPSDDEPLLDHDQEFLDKNNIRWSAAGSDPNFVEQDGEARANMKCTKCDGQTISYAGDNKFVCLTCGNEMTYEFSRDKHGSVKQAKKWMDTEGKPLRVGGEYKMSHPDYPVADFVKVTFIEPEGVRVGFTVNGHEDDLDDDRYEFEPLTTLDRTASTGLDWLKPEGPTTSTEALVDPNMFKEAGRNYSLHEQKELINEGGKARNFDRLNLKGTHYSDYDVNIRPENPGAISDEDVMLF